MYSEIIGSSLENTLENISDEVVVTTSTGSMPLKLNNSAPQYCYTTQTVPSLSINADNNSYISIFDEFVKREPHTFYKHTKPSDDDFITTMDDTMDKIIFEEVCKKVDKLIWNDIDNKYIANIVINDISLKIVIKYEDYKFQILNNDEIIINKYFEQISSLIKEIKKNLNIISKNDILAGLRTL